MSVLFLRQGGSPATPTEVTPSDNDADVSVTARTDCYGATVRPPRVTLLTAADSLANSSLADPQRGDLDSYEVRFNRVGGDERGSLYRLYAYSNRGGDAFAARYIVIDYDVIPSTLDPAVADTTSGTDCDGAHMRVPQLSLRTAMNALRNGSLTIASAGDRDARQVYFMAADELDVGYALRLLLDQDGRGGDVYAVSHYEIEYDVLDPAAMQMTQEY